MKTDKNAKADKNSSQTNGNRIIKPMATTATLFGGPFQHNQIQKVIPESAAEQAKKAWFYYKEEPLVSNAINSWMHFALGDEIVIRSEDKQIEKEANNLFKKLNLNNYLRQMVLYLLVQGDAMGFVNYNQKGDSILKVTTLNPVSIELKLDDYGELIEIIQLPNNSSALYDERKVKLPEDQFFHLKWNSMDSDPRGTSMILPAFESIELLKDYRNAERAIAKRWATPLQFIQVGGVYGGETVMPDQDTLEEIRDQVSSMDLGEGMVVPFYVNASNYGAQGEVLNTENKVKELKEDILVALGLSRSVVRGDGPNYATARVSMHKMNISLKQIKQAAKQILDWVFDNWKEINGYVDEIHYQFSDLDLNDETDQKKLLIELFDRGLLSKTTLQQKFGFSETVEENRLKEENLDKKPSLTVQEILQMASLGYISKEELREKLGFDNKDYYYNDETVTADVENIYRNNPALKFSFKSNDKKE